MEDLEREEGVTLEEFDLFEEEGVTLLVEEDLVLEPGVFFSISCLFFSDAFSAACKYLEGTDLPSNEQKRLGGINFILLILNHLWESSFPWAILLAVCFLRSLFRGVFFWRAENLAGKI